MCEGDGVAGTAHVRMYESPKEWIVSAEQGDLRPVMGFGYTISVPARDG